MHRCISSVAVIALVAALCANAISAQCTWTSPSGSFYDFTQLSRVGSSYSGQEGTDFEYALNFCTPAITPRCADQSSIALEIFGTNCRSIAPASTSPVYSFKNGIDGSQGVLMKYQGPSNAIVYELICGGNRDPAEPIRVSFNTGTYTAMSIVSLLACPSGTTVGQSPRPSLSNSQRKASITQNLSFGRTKSATKGVRSATQAYRTASKAYRTATKDAYRTATQAYRTATKGYRTASKGYRTATQAYRTATKDARPSNSFAPVSECTWRSPSGEFYDFRGLAKVGSSYEGREGSAYTYALNFCTSAISPACPQPGSFGYEISGPYCLSLAPTTNSPSFSYVNGANNANGIRMTYAGRSTVLAYVIECGSNSIPSEPFSVSYSNAVYTVSGVKTVFGCPIKSQDITIV